jgi:nucleotide sugar dehydrogenase
MKKIKDLEGKPLLGFIGQGWIGKNYANEFESRNFKVVRYSLEPEYIVNKDKIKDCDIVFIAVPTPTTPNGFDKSIVEDALDLIGEGNIAIIKSTVLPGSTKQLQQDHPKITVLYSPEFLSEATAKYDVENPFSNIIGLSMPDSEDQRENAKNIVKILPKAPFELICSSSEAEMIKYSHNVNGYFQIIMFNLLFNVAEKVGADWEVVRSAISHDPMMSNRYTQPVHKTGRGAGGGCFIKDLAAIRELYQNNFPEDTKGADVFRALEMKNIDLLLSSNKDLTLLKGVYGDSVVK